MKDINNGLSGIRSTGSYPWEVSKWMQKIREQDDGHLKKDMLYNCCAYTATESDLEYLREFFGDNPKYIDQLSFLCNKSSIEVKAAIGDASFNVGFVFNNIYPHDVFNCARMLNLCESDPQSRINFNKEIILWGPFLIGFFKAIFDRAEALYQANPDKNNPILKANHEMATMLKGRIATAICLSSLIYDHTKDIRTISYAEFYNICHQDDLCKKVGWCLDPKYLPDPSTLEQRLLLIEFLYSRPYLVIPKKYTWWEALRYFCGKGWGCCLDWWIFRPLRWLLGFWLFIWRLVTWAENWGIKK